MRLVIDTNELLNYLNVSADRQDMILAYLRRVGARLYVPEVVLGELVTHRQTSISDLHAQTSKGLRILAQAASLLNAPSLPDLTLCLEAVEPRVVDSLKSQGAIFWPPPRVPHEEVLRALQTGRKPFRGIPKSRDVGYRDFLIWSTVLEIGNKSPERGVVFVSANTRDFAAKPGELHDELKEEAERLGVDARYFGSLQSYIDAAIMPLLGTDQTLNARLEIEPAQGRFSSEVSLLLQRQFAPIVLPPPARSSPTGIGSTHPSE